MVNDSFLAVELPGNGSYEIELEYKCPGVVPGIFITMTGIVITIVMVVIGCKNNLINAKKESLADID